MWNEISRRCEMDAEEGLDLNLNEVVTFVAEVEGTQDGETLYCTSCWTPFMPDVYSFEVTRERIFDYLVDLELEDDGALDRIRAEGVLCIEADEEYEGAFAEQFRVMLRLIADRAAQEGYRTETYDDSDDLDDL